MDTYITITSSQAAPGYYIMRVITPDNDPELTETDIFMLSEPAMLELQLTVNTVMSRGLV